MLWLGETEREGLTHMHGYLMCSDYLGKDRASEEISGFNIINS